MRYATLTFISQRYKSYRKVTNRLPQLHEAYKKIQKSLEFLSFVLSGGFFMMKDNAHCITYVERKQWHAVQADEQKKCFYEQNSLVKTVHRHFSRAKTLQMYA